MNRRALQFSACGVALGIVALGIFVFARGGRGRGPLDAGAQSASAPVANAVSPAELPTPSVESPARVPIVEQSGVSPSTGVDSLQVAIVAADGTPIANAQVGLFREQALLGFDVSDAQGLARFAASSGSGEVVVLAPGYPLLRQTLELAPGLRRITLPEGEQLSGWIDVDSSAPREAIALVWLADFQPLAAFERLPQSVRERLHVQPKLEGCPATTTDAQGGFEFHGLEHGASGRLVWEGPYWLVDESRGADRRDLQLPVPRQDVRLHLSESLELRLRVVDSNGAPVPKARVQLITLQQTERGNEQSSTERAADDQGRCRFALKLELPDSVRVIVALPEGGGSTSHDVSLPGIERGLWDVGDLAVRATGALSVRVEDSEGHAVEGASVMPLPSVTGDDRVFTDVNGNCRLALALDVKGIAVLARGYDLAQIAVPPDTGELVVVLESRCQIEFVITGFDGPTRDLRVVISGAPPLFVDKDSRNARGDRGEASLGVGDQGRWQASDLRPNNALHAELRYRSGHVLAVAEIPALAKGEHRRVELPVTAQPLKLRVNVRDERGGPVANAKVTQKYARGGGTSGESVDAAGQIIVGPIYAQPFTLVAQAPGLAPKVLYGVTIPPEELTIVLEAPQRVALELQNPDGSLFVGKAEVFASTNGAGDGTCTSSEAGRWILDGLPRGEITIYVESEFGELTALHDTANLKRVLIVGESGSVLVKMNSAGGHETQEWAVALADAGSAQPRTRTRFFFDAAGRKDIEFKGLPMGAYVVWLETRGALPDGLWSRIGASASTKLDLEHPRGSVELSH